jgi:hypothetical protein
LQKRQQDLENNYLRNQLKSNKMKKNPGFKAVQKKIAQKQGVSMERAGAILATGARKASPAAKKANPALKKVKGKAKY